MESDLPWFHAAVRQRLAADTDFMAACFQRLTEHANQPTNVNVPYATIQFPTSIGSLGGGGYRPMVQVDGWAPDEGYGGVEASLLVWRMVSRAKRALEACQNVNYQTMYWSARPTDLLALPKDVSRGESNPLAHAATRAVLTVHNR